jgi:hypothetical protein
MKGVDVLDIKMGALELREDQLLLKADTDEGDRSFVGCFTCTHRYRHKANACRLSGNLDQTVVSSSDLPPKIPPSESLFNFFIAKTSQRQNSCAPANLISLHTNPC